MRLFIHEFVTGGGLWSTGSDSPAGSLLGEGQAMLRALVDDCSSIPGLEVRLLRDVRLPPDECLRAIIEPVSSASDERRLVARMSREVDGVLLLAPEMHGALADRVNWVEQSGGRVLSPGAPFVGSTADKNVLAKRLRAAGVRVPAGVALSPQQPLPRDFLYPAVLKPADGAGSCGVQHINGPDDQADRSGFPSWRLETFQPGVSASVAVLNGPAGRIPLPAMVQRLGGASGFEYLGGAGPLPEPLNRRAQKLALAALGALPPATGYVGADLILGNDPHGSEDTLIEINPRLTTSYVGLRKLCVSNLVQAMIDVARGRSCDVRFRVGSIEFDCEGGVTSSSSTI